LSFTNFSQKLNVFYVVIEVPGFQFASCFFLFVYELVAGMDVVVGFLSFGCIITFWGRFHVVVLMCGAALR